MTEEEQVKMLWRHETDLYFGKGKDDPPIIGRLLLMEDAVGRLIRNLSKIVWLLVGTLIIGILNLFFHSFGH